MTLTPVEGFVPLITHHCVTGSLRNIYAFHGHPLSEEMLLGLGAGVGFVYWHMEGTTPFYGGRANVGRPGEDGLEKTAGRRTGVHIEWYQTSSPRKAEQSLLSALCAGQPVMLQVDMGYLPYLELPEGYHFGAHMVVAAGCDSEAQMVLVADRDGCCHPVSLEDLEKARGSRWQPFPPRRRWYVFDFTRFRPPRTDEVCLAIQQAARGMLEPPISNLGVKGIAKAAERTLQWPRSMVQAELRNACFNTFVFIDAAGGTGGGIFRYMYGRFLREAAAMTGIEGLQQVGEEMLAIGDSWQEVALLFRQASSAPDPATALPTAAELVRSIADQEQATWERLAAIVSQGCKDGAAPPAF